MGVGAAHAHRGGGQIAMCRVYVKHGVWTVRLCCHKGSRKGERVPVALGFTLGGIDQCYPTERRYRSDDSPKDSKLNVHRCPICGIALSRDHFGICWMCERDRQQAIPAIVVRPCE